MAVQVSMRLSGKVTFVGTTSCVKVGATAETEGGKDGEVATRLSALRCSFYVHYGEHDEVVVVVVK